MCPNLGSTNTSERVPRTSSHISNSENTSGSPPKLLHNGSRLVTSTTRPLHGLDGATFPRHEGRQDRRGWASTLTGVLCFHQSRETIGRPTETEAVCADVFGPAMFSNVASGVRCG